MFCNFFKAGRCNRGDKCDYSHDKAHDTGVCLEVQDGDAAFLAGDWEEVFPPVPCDAKDCPHDAEELCMSDRSCNNRVCQKHTAGIRGAVWCWVCAKAALAKEVVEDICMMGQDVEAGGDSLQESNKTQESGAKSVGTDLSASHVAT